VPGYTEKSRRYLRLAVENCRRAGECDSPEVKAKFLEIAGQYRDLALQTIRLRGAVGLLPTPNLTEAFIKQSGIETEPATRRKKIKLDRKRNNSGAP
jgi:hypothetical protein